MEQLSQATAPDAAGPRSRETPPGQVLAIVSAGVVLASLDLFIVNVALPDISRDFGHASLGELSWVLNGYAIVYAALLVFFGRLADRHRRNDGFLLGVAIFTRTWTAMGGLAAALGPVIGGLLVTASWRWVFLVNVPIGVAALVVGWLKLPEVPGHPVRRPDALGAALVTAGVGAVTFGLVQGNTWGWGSPGTVTALAGSAVLLGLFVAHCVTSGNPLVAPALFKVASFSGASLAMALFSASFGAMLLSIAVWEQNDWGWSALKAGLAIAPGPIMVPLCSFLVAGRLIRRFGPAAVVALGSTVFAGGLAWWAIAIGLRPDYAGSMLGGMLLTGTGVGLTLPTLMATAAGSLPPHSFATGSAVVNMIRQIGLAVGVAALVVVLGGPGTAAQRLAAFHRGWWVTAAIALAGVIPALLLLRRGSVAAAPG